MTRCTERHRVHTARMQLLSQQWTSEAAQPAHTRPHMRHTASATMRSYTHSLLRVRVLVELCGDTGSTHRYYITRIHITGTPECPTINCGPVPHIHMQYCPGRQRTGTEPEVRSSTWTWFYKVLVRTRVRKCACIMDQDHGSDPRIGGGLFSSLLFSLLSFCVCVCVCVCARKDCTNAISRVRRHGAKVASDAGPSERQACVEDVASFT
jgi:hypothetical protein